MIVLMLDTTCKEIPCFEARGTVLFLMIMLTPMLWLGPPELITYLATRYPDAYRALEEIQTHRRQASSSSERSTK